MADTVTGGRQFPLESKTISSDYLWGERRFRINKDNRERIGINYSVHSVSLQKGVHIHNAANKYVFSMDYEALANLRELAFVGFKGSVRSKTILKVCPKRYIARRNNACKTYFKWLIFFHKARTRRYHRHL